MFGKGVFWTEFVFYGVCYRKIPSASLPSRNIRMYVIFVGVDFVFLKVYIYLYNVLYIIKYLLCFCVDT